MSDCVHSPSSSAEIWTAMDSIFRTHRKISPRQPLIGSIQRGPWIMKVMDQSVTMNQYESGMQKRHDQHIEVRTCVTVD